MHAKQASWEREWIFEENYPAYFTPRCEIWALWPAHSLNVLGYPALSDTAELCTMWLPQTRGIEWPKALYPKVLTGLQAGRI
jgi:hypothetical protein